MKRLRAIYAAIAAAAKTYPNATAILLSTAVAVAARAGLKITENEIITVFAFANMFFSTIAHYSYRTHEAKSIEQAKS